MEENIRLAECEYSKQDLVNKYTFSSIFQLLNKKVGRQYLSCLSKIKLDETYEVKSLRGQNGVITTEDIPRYSCVAIYEGCFVPPKYKVNKYTMITISDYCLPNDPEWDEYKTTPGIIYHIDPKISSNHQTGLDNRTSSDRQTNILIFINDYRNHTKCNKNIEYITFMVNDQYPMFVLLQLKTLKRDLRC